MAVFVVCCLQLSPPDQAHEEAKRFPRASRTESDCLGSETAVPSARRSCDSDRRDYSRCGSRSERVSSFLPDQAETHPGSGSCIRLEEIESGTSPLHPKLASWRDFKRSLAVHMKFLKEFNMLRGCPLAIIGNELTEEDDTVRQVLSLVFDALTKRIAALFLKLKTEGRLPRNANERQLAEFCVAVMQGSMVVGKVRGKSEAVAQIFKEMVSHFEEFRLSPRN